MFPVDLISQQYSECNAGLATYLKVKYLDDNKLKSWRILVDEIMNNSFLYFDSMEVFLCVCLTDIKLLF